LQKLLTGPELVRQREPYAEVGVEVQQMPRFVAQAASCGLDTGDDDHDQTDGPGDGKQHAAISGDQIPGRRQDLRPLARGVAGDDHHDVGDHQGEGKESDQPMDPGQPVTSKGMFQRWQPRHQQHLHQQQIC
jgi:hypothetical protein